MTPEDKKISDIYQSVESIEPSSHLDETILAASRQAIKHKTRSRGPFSGGWPVTASVAALVLITIVIAPITMREMADKELAPEPRAIVMESRDKNLAQKKKARQATVPDDKPPMAAKMAQRKADIKTELKSPAVTFSPEPASPEKPARLGQQMAESISESEHSGFAGFSDDKMAGMIATGKQQEKQSVVKKQFLAENKAKRLRKNNSAIMLNSAAPATALESAPARAPDDWLKTIEQLMDDNEPDKAKKEFEAFRKTYPDYNVDTKLLDRLKEM